MTSPEQPQRAAEGFYCSTSGTYFSDKESLAEHYKSDFHRYNLKRKVAGLPPVTKEWFEARRAQLSSAAASPHAKVWYDPLTKKKFQTQQTYQAHVNSKKYQQLVRESGEPAPAPIISMKPLQQQLAQQQQQQEEGAEQGGAAAAGRGSGSTGASAEAKPAGAASKAAAGFTVKAPARTSAAAAAACAAAAGDASDDGNEDDEGDASGWETASDSDEGREGDEDEDDWEEWDVRVSLFDNRLGASMQDNLQYMYRTFGFYLPDAEYLTDPEGLLKYLGAKLRYGKVPLYSAGDDPNARQFRSLHAVQRHMVDRNQCKMLFDGNEDEYADFYDFSGPSGQEGEEGEGEDGGAEAGAPAGGDTAANAAAQQLALALDGLALSPSAAPAQTAAQAGGWELAVSAGGGGGGGTGGGGSKVLGSRELARYYRQRPKPQDTRHSVVVNTIIAQYRSLGVATHSTGPAPEERAAQRRQQHDQKRQQQRLWMRTNVNNNLPKNVPY